MGIVGGSMQLQELKTQILADGEIDAEEVVKLRDMIFDDGVVDRDEVDVLFELNDKATVKDPTFGDLFVEAISKHVLSDEVSPGAIDQDEADYLVAKVMNDGQVDDLERRLLTNIKANATSIHANLQTKLTELAI